MSYRNPKEQGVKIPQDHRTGVGGFPPFRGVKKAKNPASLADNQFDLLQNVRIKKGVIRERGGLVKAATNAFPGVQGFHDASDIGAPAPVTPPWVSSLVEGIYMITNSPASGDWFSYTLTGEAPTKYQLPTTGIATFARPFQTQGKLVIGTKAPGINTNTYLYQWTPTDGVTVGHVFTVNFPDSFWRGRAISAGCEFGAHFYFSVYYEENTDFGLGPVEHHLLIYQWDGVNAPILEKDQVFLQTQPSSYNDPGAYNTWALYSDGNELYAINKAAEGAEGAGPTPANKILRRGGGTWAALALPGSTYFGASLHPAGISYGALVRYNGVTYIAGHDQNAAAGGASIKTLKILNGDTGAVVWSRVNTTMAGWINLFVADDKLYYNYSDAAAAVYRTGRFDGTTWNDTFKNWNAAPQSVALIPNNVVDFGGELWCSLGEAGRLRKTVSRDVAGLWVQGDFDLDHANWLDVYVSP